MARRAAVRTVRSSVSVLVRVTLEPQTGLSRALVSDVIAEATSSTVVDGVSAAETRLGFADERPSDGEYAVAFDGPDPDAAGRSAVILSAGGGKIYAQHVSASGGSRAGQVPEGVSPADVIADPDLIGSPDAPTPEPSTPAPTPDPTPEPTPEPTPDPTPEPVLPPAAPANVRSVVVPGMTTMSWDGPSPSWYEVTAVPDTGSTVTCQTSGTSCVLFNTASGRTYTVTVTAFGTDGQHTAAAPVTVKAAPAPVRVTANWVASTGTLRATWPASPDATSFEVGTRVNGGAWTTESVSPSTLERTIVAQPGQTVEVRVAVVAPWSKSTSASSGAYTRPALP